MKSEYYGLEGDVLEITYRTDELENSIDYLERVTYYYLQDNFKHRMKWLMITLHGALYGFGVLAIRGSQPTATVYKPLEKSIGKRKISEYTEALVERNSEISLENQGAYLQGSLQANYGQLLSIYDVIERCQKEEFMNRSVTSKILELSEVQSVAIEKLVLYRNQFAHFKPMLYGISEDYNIDIVFPVLEVIRFLALESYNIIYYETDQEMRVRKALASILDS